MIEEQTKSSQAVAKAKKHRAATNQPTMYIKVYSPFRVYFEGEAYSITGFNKTGPFDILPQHHNFITLLAASELLIKPATGPLKEQKIRISGGLMHVKADRVTVFLNI